MDLNFQLIESYGHWKQKWYFRPMIANYLAIGTEKVKKDFF